MKRGGKKDPEKLIKEWKRKSKGKKQGKGEQKAPKRKEMGNMKILRGSQRSKKRKGKAERRREKNKRKKNRENKHKS